MKKLLLLLITLSLLVGCNSADKFPTTVSHSDGDAPVKSLENFVNARAEVLLASANDYLKYAELITTNQKVPDDLFESGKYLGLENKNSTRSIAGEFSRSSQGAYLSDQDKDFINRLIDEKVDQINEILTKGNGVVNEKEQGDEAFLVSAYWAEQLFFGSSIAKEDISLTDHDLFTGIAEEIKAAMIKDGRKDLWVAYRDSDKDYLDEYRANDKNPSFSAFVNPAITKVVCKNMDTERVADMETKRFFYSQLFQAVPFDQILTVLDQGRFNDYIRLSDSFNRWGLAASNALKRVDKEETTEKT